MRLKRIFVGLLWFLTCAISVSAEPSEVNLETLAGRVISSVSFAHFTNLDQKELLAPLPIRVGDTLNIDLLETAIDTLYQREIFAHVDLSVFEDGEAVSIQFTLTPLLQLREVTFSGNSTLTNKQLARVCGLRPYQRVSYEAFYAAKSRILKAYREAGHRSASLQLSVEQHSLAPQIIAELTISEGYQSQIADVKLLGEFPEELLELKEDFISRAKGQIASDEKIQDLGQELLIAMRNEGYLASAVKLDTKDYEPLSGDIFVTWKVLPRAPLSIILEGNTVFTTEELLELLRIDTRTVPFTPGAIPKLSREIVGHYQQHGYFATTTEHQRLASDGDRQRYNIKINEGALAKLSAIHFSGNKSIDDEELLQVMSLAGKRNYLIARFKPVPLTKAGIENDIAAIRDLYQRRGFFDTEVSFELGQGEDPGHIELEISINEHSQDQIRDVQVVFKNIANEESSGSHRETLLQITSELPTGIAFDSDLIAEERKRLEHEVAQLGFPNTRISLEQSPQDGIVRFVIEADARVRVGEILIRGNIFTHDNVIMRELTFRKGDLWSPHRIQESKSALFRRGIFRSVRINPIDGSLNDPYEDLVIEVQERDTGTFRTGIGFDTEDGLRIQTKLAQRNLAGRGNTLSLGVDGYFKSGDRIFDAGLARLAFMKPHFLYQDLNLFTEVFLQNEVELENEFSFDRAGTSFTLRYPFTERLFANAGMTVFYEDVFDVPKDIIIGPDDTGSTTYSLFRSAFDYDRRDDQFNPRSGYRTRLNLDLASSVVGSDAEFFSASVQQSYFLPVTTFLTWANNARFQLIEPFGDTDVIPLSKRLFLGGRRSLRGFSQSSVGPRGEQQNIVGGDQSLVLNSELQFDMTASIQLLLFLDAGQAVLENEGTFSGNPLSFNLSDLRYSPGIGMRLKTPIGPIGIEYGVALEREFGERFGRLGFNIGGTF